MPENAENVPHVPRKRPNFPGNAQNPEKMPKIPGICRRSFLPIMAKVMPAYSVWPSAAARHDARHALALQDAATAAAASATAAVQDASVVAELEREREKKKAYKAALADAQAQLSSRVEDSERLHGLEEQLAAAAEDRDRAQAGLGCILMRHASYSSSYVFVYQRSSSPKALTW